VDPIEKPLFEHAGWCPICEADATFSSTGPYFRNTLKCLACRTGPRQRAVMEVLGRLFPNWKTQIIHECSPAMGLSDKLARECKGYVGTHYDTSVPFGEISQSNGYRSEDLEAQTFSDESFDIVITQDVFEHIFHPDRAIKEIARTMRPGGAHVMTTPITRKERPSRRRAAIVNGNIEYLRDQNHHGNPIDKSGSLVTIDWGYDIAAYLAEHSGLSIMIMDIDNIDHGIRADLNEVIICRKLEAPHL
jgi:SAM-dependent methyltransferase